MKNSVCVQLKQFKSFSIFFFSIGFLAFGVAGDKQLKAAGEVAGDLAGNLPIVGDGNPPPATNTDKNGGGE